MQSKSLMENIKSKKETLPSQGMPVNPGTETKSKDFPKTE
jgi:hypothetical protein